MKRINQEAFGNTITVDVWGFIRPFRLPFCRGGQGFKMSLWLPPGVFTAKRANKAQEAKDVLQHLLKKYYLCSEWSANSSMFHVFLWGHPPNFNLYSIISNWVQPKLSWPKGGCWLISIASENAKWDVLGLWQQGSRGRGRNRQEIRWRLNDVQRCPLVSVFWMLFFPSYFWLYIIGVSPKHTMSQMNICLSFGGESSLAAAPSFHGQSLTLPR